MAEADDGKILGQSIIGRVLDDGWVVKSFDCKKDDETGGTYSKCFIVSRDGEEGYMKVYNLQKYQERHGNSGVDVLNRLTADYIYERSLLDSCRDAHLDQVCFAIGSGDLKIEVAPGFVFPSPYFIFPKAYGDIQRYLHKPEEEKEKHWQLKVAHQVAVAMMQLNQVGINHQDLKPSNVLQFPGKDKISDLGRSFSSNRECPFIADPFWGDHNYHSPEVAYQAPPQENKLRAAYTDLYLLGSFIYHLYTGCTINSYLYRDLEPEMRPSVPGMTYALALPFLQELHSRCMMEFADNIDLPSSLKDDLVSLVSGLTNPDYKIRGNPNVSSLSFVYSSHLIRTTTTLDYILKKAQTSDD